MIYFNPKRVGLSLIFPLSFHKKTGYYLNAAIKILYFNILFIQFILDINCDNMMNYLDIIDKKFASNDQKVLILKDPQKIFCEMYLGGKKTIVTDDLFIVKNIRI